MDNSKKDDVSFWIPLFVVVLGAFAAILNNSSINVALPKLMAVFGADTDEVQWVVTAFMLTSGVVIPVTGYLGNYLGMRRLYIIALSIFTLGSFLCSLSWSLNTLIAARVIQGIGSGVIMPVSMAIIYKLVPKEKIGTALGVWGVSAMAAPAIGPTLGGYIVDHLSWHFVFSMNIPVGLVGILAAFLFLSFDSERPSQKFDLPGFIFSTGGCFALLLALSEGHKEGWGSQYIVTLLTVGIFSLILFALIELNQEEPMLQLRVFKNGIFSLSVIATSVITIGLFGGIFLIPLYTQNLMGLTPMQTGLLLMPSAITSALISPLSGFLFDRLGAAVPSVVGLFITTWGTWELSTLSLQTSFREIQLLMVVRAVGMGLAMMPMTTAGMNAISRSQTGEASAISNVCRQIFASFGVAFLTSVLQQRQTFHAARLAEGCSISALGPAQALSQLVAFLGGTGAASQQATAILAGLVQKEAFTLAIDDTFIIATLFVLVAIPLAFFLPSRGKSNS